MINYQDIEDAIMGVVQEQLSYVKTLQYGLWRR